MTLDTEAIEEWESVNKPLPIAAIRVSSGDCEYDCPNEADFLVKVENRTGQTAKFKLCEDCDKKNQVFAERQISEDDT